ncbi:Crp/Fnr family transcriptional regulator [Pedobacter sp. 22163]|uniref:Crp/Fnr family transcriptional regulator n=1 Tax=Pedobacter sp. 22163 TaxID=3453883 RepID=UPI003F82DE62
MNSEIILANINQLVQINNAEAYFLESILISRPFRQDELIINSGDIARYVMFVNAGYIMSFYTDADGNDHVVQFAAQNWWSGDLFSLSDHPRTIYSTKGLTEGELLLLPRSAQEELFSRFPKFERYFRISFQNSLIRQQMRLIEGYTLTAEERYIKFQEKFPTIDRYIAQKYIASYLGMTPEFLSRTRKKILSK